MNHNKPACRFQTVTKKKSKKSKKHSESNAEPTEVATDAQEVHDVSSEIVEDITPMNAEVTENTSWYASKCVLTFR